MSCYQCLDTYGVIDIRLSLAFHGDLGSSPATLAISQPSRLLSAGWGLAQPSESPQQTLHMLGTWNISKNYRWKRHGACTCTKLPCISSWTLFIKDLGSECTGKWKPPTSLCLAVDLWGGICSWCVAVFQTLCFPGKVRQLSSSPIFVWLHLNNLRGSRNNPAMPRPNSVFIYHDWLFVFCPHIALERVTSGMGINGLCSETLLTSLISRETYLCLDPVRQL